MPNLTFRLAEEKDQDALRELIVMTIDRGQEGYLTPQQIQLSHRFMGLDTQLVADRTYFVVEADDAPGVIVGCGGWSWRATLYGGDHSTSLRNADGLDPAKDAAKVRAMYTRPGFERRGIGRGILQRCEQAARDAGFKRAEMMATIAGIPLYEACGYQQIERVIAASENGVDVPCVKMGKSL